MNPVLPIEISEPVPGLRLVTERMPYVRSSCVGIWIDFGSRDETDDLAGAAHLLEHLPFKGTSTRSAREIADTMDAVGGELNAFTSREYTCYYARMLDKDTALGVDLLVDMFTDASLNDVDVESERKVVLEEIHETWDNPEEWVHDRFGEVIWPGHALGRPITGTVDTVSAITADDLRAIHAEHYRPGKVVVAASGNVQHADLAAALANRLEGDTLSRRTPANPPTFEPLADYRVRDTEQVHIVWGAPAPSRHDEDRFAIAVFNTIYGGSSSSRLFQTIREERGLAYTVYSATAGYCDAGLLAVYVGVSPQTAEETMKVVRDELAGLAAGNVTADELARAKGHVEGSLVLGLDESGGRMSRLGKAELVYGRIDSVDELLERVEQVTAEDVTRVAQSVCGHGGFALCCMGPVANGSLDAAALSV